jgi:hypothetical protein
MVEMSMLLMVTLSYHQFNLLGLMVSIAYILVFHQLSCFTDHSRPISRLKVDARIKAALPDLIVRFLRRQLYNHNATRFGNTIRFRGNVSVFHSARAVFYAPSELSGAGGMHSEIIRSVPHWYGEDGYRATVLVQNGDEDEIMGGILVARVHCFIAFKHEGIRYPCAVVEWYDIIGDHPDPVTGMWVVAPEKKDNGEPLFGLIHTDCIIRSCHLSPVFGRQFIPKNINHTHTLDIFNAYYLNRYADYHTHECYPD